ncbi:MAG: WbqC family protein [Paludibacteraceae bacterium]|nr:WbqC family protein [Paludibacteraceae bacterium]
MSTVLLTGGYLCDIRHYSKMLHYGSVAWETCCSYHKQTLRNRCRILTADGVADLCIPVVKPHDGHCQTREMRVADEPWQKLHWGAIQAAYNKSPFLLYVADDLERLYQKRYRFLVDVQQDFHALVCQWMGLSFAEVRTSEYQKQAPDDYRSLTDYKHSKEDPHFVAVPYWQVFAGKFGFTPNLSILDLLLNTGQEGRIILRQCYRDCAIFSSSDCC